METFRRQFVYDSVQNLKILQNNLRDIEDFSDSEKREVFRTLHTIKGTAQTLAFDNSSRLAHELETILSVKQIISTEKFSEFFTEGIGLLINSLRQKDFEFPTRFVEKVQRLIPQKPRQFVPVDFPPEIPPKILASLSGIEKIALDSALQNEKSLWCFEVGFDLANFTEKFKELRDNISNSSDIIATFPSKKFNDSGKIGFQILFASSAKKSIIEDIANTQSAEIMLNISPKIFTEDLQGILSKIIAHGKNLASKFGKTIDFEIAADKIDLPVEKLKSVFNILLHLTRNAIDHAIDKKGVIKINIKFDKNGWHLIFADNGSGVDLEKVKAIAIEKNLISAGKILTEQATLNLILQSQFSTASEITEISGRGIGLDIVKDTIERLKGTVNVKSRSGKGTTFEIF